MLKKEEFQCGASVIFCNTIKCANLLVKTLKTLGYAAECFHGKVPAASKENLYPEFINGSIKILVTCRSYGMGIDNPVISHIIHFDMPRSMAEFMQRSSIAGRNEEDAQCYVFLDKV